MNRMPALVPIVVVLLLLAVVLLLLQVRRTPERKPPGAAATSPGGTLPKEYDEGFYPLVLRVGETGKAHGVTVTLEAVERDGRCPRSVQCAEAGVATVRITITSPVPGARPVVKTPSIQGSLPYSPPNDLGSGLGNLARDAGASVYFVRLDPYPERPNEPIPSSSYRATFAVRHGPE